MDNLPIEKYNGIGRGESFLKDYQAVCSSKGMRANDARKGPMMRVYLTGAAKTWHDNLPEQVTNDWGQLEAAFRAKYVPALDAQQAIILHEKLLQIKLKEHEQLEDYIARIVEVGTELGKTQEEMTATMMSGLPEKLGFYVRARNPEDLDEALAVAKLGERLHYRDPAPRPTPTASAGLERQIENLTATLNAVLPSVMAVASIARQGELYRSAPTHQPAVYAATQQGPPPPLIPPPAPPTPLVAPLLPPRRAEGPAQHGEPRQPVAASDMTRPSLPPAPRPKLVCGQCQGTGHRDHFCNKPPHVGLRPHFFCEQCGQYGHSQRFCALTLGNR